MKSKKTKTIGFRASEDDLNALSELQRMGLGSTDSATIRLALFTYYHAILEIPVEMRVGTDKVRYKLKINSELLPDDEGSGGDVNDEK